MKPADSYVRNCILVQREAERDSGKVLFHASKKHGVMAALDGYAIIPIELYEARFGAAPQGEGK